MSLTFQDPSMVDQPAKDASMTAAAIVRDLTYAQVIAWAAVIGIAGGLVATAYYYLLESSMHLVWHQIPEMLQAQHPHIVFDQKLCVDCGIDRRAACRTNSLLYGTARRSRVCSR